MKQQEEKKGLVQVEQDKDILDKVKALLNKEWVWMKIQSARKKPVEIEFVQYNGGNKKELYDWSEGLIHNVWESISGEAELGVETLEGFLIIDTDDYVIKGVHGEFYPCKPDIFHKTYEVIKWPNT